MCEMKTSSLTVMADAESETPVLRVLACLARYFCAAVVVLAVVMMVLVASFMTYACKREFLLPNGVLLLVGVVAVALAVHVGMRPALCRFANWLRDHGRTADVAVAVATLVLLVVQVRLCRACAFTSGWDSGVLTHWSWAYVHKGTIDAAYFSQYPNNTLILWVAVQCARIAVALGAVDAIGTVYVFAALNCVSCAIALWAAYRAASLVSSRAVGLLTWLGCVAMVWTSPWAGILYSDGLALMFPAAELLLYVRSCCASERGRWLYLALLGLVGIVGFRIKPQVVFVLFAVVGFEFVRTAVSIARSLRDRNLRRASAQVIPLVFGAVGALVAFALTNALVSTISIKLDEDAAMGTSHFLMMGLNPVTRGVYFGEDVAFSASFPDVASRTAANLRVVAERISEYGPGGLLALFADKLMTNFNDGTFAWGVEGHFFDAVDPNAGGMLTGFLRSLYIPGGIAYDLWQTYAQGVWVLTLALVPVGLTAGIRSREDALKRQVLAVAAAALLMLVTFELVFEARARYLYTYVPIFIMLAAQGFVALRRAFAARRTSPSLLK